MSFTQQSTRIPTSIGAIYITLIDRPATGEDPAVQSARFQVYVNDQNGQTMNVPEGNIVPHLQQSDIDWLMNFISRVRTKAIDELLP